MVKGKRYKTFVIDKSGIDGVFFLCAGTVAVLVVFIAACIGMGNKTFAKNIIGNFIGTKTAYAYIAEALDNENRIDAIIGTYTMTETKEKNDTNTPQIAREDVKTEQTPQVTESKTVSSSEIKNQSGKTVDTEKLLAEPLAFEKDGKKPCVLIVHTHTTESYLEQDRSIDETKNMIAIGTVIKDRLENGGIKVIHDTTVHDYPTYNGAYTRSAATVKNRLAENPDINIVLDIHRDAVAANDGKKVSLVTEINGEKTAQLMFVVGTDAQLTHEKWHENLKLALKLQRTADELYPTLMRPINLREQRFNQQLSEGSIILEVGANGNSIDEAKHSAELISNVLIKLLNNN